MCGGTGVIETGNNDIPCPCPVGAIAVFNVSTADGPKQMTGAELSKHWREETPHKSATR